MLKYVLIAFAAISLLTFVSYGLDKHAAKQKTWRVPERRLLLFGFAGGAAGALLGMQIFHHKTRKPRFWVVNILGLLWQIALCMYLLLNK